MLHLAAIRTKEFALGMVAVLALWDMLLLRRDDWRKRCLRLAPHALWHWCCWFVMPQLYRQQAGKRKAAATACRYLRKVF